MVLCVGVSISDNNATYFKYSRKTYFWCILGTEKADLLTEQIKDRRVAENAVGGIAILEDTAG